MPQEDLAITKSRRSHNSLGNHLVIVGGIFIVNVALWLLLATNHLHANLIASYSKSIRQANEALAFEHSPGQWSIVDDQDMSADDSQTVYSAPKASRMFLTAPFSLHGFPFIRRQESLDVHVQPLKNGLALSKEDQSAMKHAYLQYTQVEPSLLRLGFNKPWRIGVTQSRVDPWLTANAIVWCLVTIAIPWLLWRTISLARRLMLHRREAKLLAASLCPRCRYDLSSLLLAGVTTCPECGLSVTPPPRSASAGHASAHLPPPPSPAGPQA